MSSLNYTWYMSGFHVFTATTMLFISRTNTVLLFTKPFFSK